MIESDETVFEYLYRDASNYKQFGAVRLLGKATSQLEQRVRATLDDVHFVPEQVGLEPLQSGLKAYDSAEGDDDHAWHELVCLRSANLNDMNLPLHGALLALVESFEAVDSWNVEQSSEHSLLRGESR